MYRVNEKGSSMRDVLRRVVPIRQGWAADGRYFDFCLSQYGESKHLMQIPCANFIIGRFVVSFVSRWFHVRDFLFHAKERVESTTP